MAYTRNAKPYPPAISNLSSVWHDDAPPSVFFRARIEPYADGEEAGVDQAYSAYVAPSEQEAKALPLDILTPHSGGTEVPLLIPRGISNAPNSMLPEALYSDAYLDFTKIPGIPEWFGKDLWLALRRNVLYGQSDVSTAKFYYPHFDEPLYTLEELEPAIYRPTSERVLTRIWTCSATINDGEVYPNSDSFKADDVFLYFNSTDGVFHKICYVISFYDHAGVRGSGLSQINTPYNRAGLPIYFSTEAGSAYLYNPELVGALFTSEEQPDLSPLLDNYSMISYNFPDVGKQYVGLIGNITTTNTFDGIRFRIHNMPNLATYKMYLHIFIDGEYANPESVLLGRGYPATSPAAVNGFVLDDNVVTLSSLLPVNTTETAVKLNCLAGSSPRYWSASVATKYSRGCPSEETGDC